MSNDLFTPNNPFTSSNSGYTVTISGRCEKCFAIIDHDCSHGRGISRRAQSGSNINLEQKNNKSFECKFCNDIIAHNCNNLFFPQKNEKIII